MRQIKKRGRPFEQEIKEDYLRKIDQGYENLMQTNFSFPVVKIEVDELNFEADTTAFQSMLRKIYATTFL
jgi:deoxyadenosine/deoxycytidine kinase